MPSIVKYRVSVLQVKEDGDCIFSALLASLQPTSTAPELMFSAYDLRRQVGMYMLKHKEEIFPLLEPQLECDGISFRRYVVNTMEDMIWGDYGEYLVHQATPPFF